MIKIILIAYLFNLVQGYLTPLIYAAPSAVSHQSRIDIKHNPIISAPLIYNPGQAIVAIHSEPARAIVAPIIATDTLLAPVALSFFHNLPLARALKHPISIEEVQEDKAVENVVAQELKEDAITAQDINTKSIERESEAIVVEGERENGIKQTKNGVSASNIKVQSQWT